MAPSHSALRNSLNLGASKAVCTLGTPPLKSLLFVVAISIGSHVYLFITSDLPVRLDWQASVLQLALD